MRKCVSGCMSKDTRIMMGDGSEKIITEIHIGDSVLLSSGETDRISDIFTGVEFEMLHIETNNSSLVVTDGHPILSDGEKWVQAFYLKIGDSVCIKNGTLLPIKNSYPIHIPYSLSISLLYIYKIPKTSFLISCNIPISKPP